MLPTVTSNISVYLGLYCRSIYHTVLVRMQRLIRACYSLLCVFNVILIVINGNLVRILFGVMGICDEDFVGRFTLGFLTLESRSGIGRSIDVNDAPLLLGVGKRLVVGGRY